MLLYIFPTINRIQNWITNDEVFFLYVAHVLTAPLLGFVNAIVYGLDEDIRKRYKVRLALRQRHPLETSWD